MSHRRPLHRRLGDDVRVVATYFDATGQFLDYAVFRSFEKFADTPRVEAEAIAYGYQRAHDAANDFTHNHFVLFRPLRLRERLCVTCSPNQMGPASPQITRRRRRRDQCTALSPVQAAHDARRHGSRVADRPALSWQSGSGCGLAGRRGALSRGRRRRPFYSTTYSAALAAAACAAALAAFSAMTSLAG